MKEVIWSGIIKWYFHFMGWLSLLLHALMDHQIRQCFDRQAIGCQCLWWLRDSTAHAGSRNGPHVCINTQTQTYTRTQLLRNTEMHAEIQTHKQITAVAGNNFITLNPFSYCLHNEHMSGVVLASGWEDHAVYGLIFFPCAEVAFIWIVNTKRVPVSLGQANTTA